MQELESKCMLPFNSLRLRTYVYVPTDRLIFNPTKFIPFRESRVSLKRVSFRANQFAIV